MVEAEVFRSSLPSKIVVHFVHNPDSNSSHTQRDFSLLVTFLNQSITIDSTIDLSILYSTHLRVRVTALGCALTENEPSSTITIRIRVSLRLRLKGTKTKDQGSRVKGVLRVTIQATQNRT